MSIQTLQRSLNYIDRGIKTLGLCASWAALIMTLFVAVIVVLRYGFKEGFIALQESVTYLHAFLFMCGAAFTLQSDEHVRVDIFYRQASPGYRAWINALGNIVFLIPFCMFVFFNSWSFVSKAWAIKEGSAEAGGIDAVYLLKALIPIMALTLFVQALAQTIRHILFLMNVAPEESSSEEVSLTQQANA